MSKAPRHVRPLTLTSQNETNGMDPLKRSLYTLLALVLTTAFTLGPPTAEAQNEPGAAYLGVMGGVAQTSLTGDNADSDNRSGFTGGAHFMYNFNEALSLDVEFRYTRRGAESFTATPTSDRSNVLDFENDDYRLEYIDIPVLAKITAPIEAVKVRAFAGPSLNLRFNSTINGDHRMRFLQSNRKVDSRNLFYDVGGVLGGEIAVPLPVPVTGLQNAELVLDGRYQFGFINLDTIEGFDYSNRELSGTIGIRFGLSSMARGM